METNELTAPFERMLEGLSSPAQVRTIEATASLGEMWTEIDASGFLDALVPESCGGAGLSLADVSPLLQALGRHAVCAPIGETMIARALLAGEGLDLPSGPIVLATPVAREAAAVPLAMTAGHVLAQFGARLVLTPVAQARVAPTGVHRSLAANLSWETPPTGPSLAAPACGLRAVAAVLRAATIAGAADRLLAMTVEYANARVQFGKPIGKLQAVQQQMAVMAEQAVAARIAAQIGCAGGLPPTTAAAAVAKQVTSSAAAQIAQIAHAVHGAIGISEEFDLQLYTRRLYEWRLADGSEAYWAGVLGAERIAQAGGSSLEFVRGLEAAR